MAYELLIMAFYKPYFIKSIPFLIPMGIRIINCFLKEKKSVFITLYVMIVQLSFYGQIDLLSIISFLFQKDFRSGLSRGSAGLFSSCQSESG